MSWEGEDGGGGGRDGTDSLAIIGGSGVKDCVIPVVCFVGYKAESRCGRFIDSRLSFCSKEASRILGA